MADEQDAGGSGPHQSRPQGQGAPAPDPAAAAGAALPPAPQSKTRNKSKKGRNGKKRSLWWLKAFFLTLGLSAVFSLVSELVTAGSHVVLSFILLVVFLVISIVADAIGTAATACAPEPFQAMASRKIRGAKVSLSLLKKADVMASVCNDVIGDICGIMSGALSAAIVLKLFLDHNFIAGIVMSSIVAAVMVGAKAFCKGVAIRRAKEIIGLLGKLLYPFVRKKNR